MQTHIRVINTKRVSITYLALRLTLRVRKGTRQTLKEPIAHQVPKRESNLHSSFLKAPAGILNKPVTCPFPSISTAKALAQILILILSQRGLPPNILSLLAS